MAGTYLTQKRRQLIVRPMRVGVRLRRALATERIDTVAGWQQWFPKRQVQMDRAWRRDTNRMLYRAEPCGQPAETLVRCPHGDASVVKPFDESAEEVLLVDRLVSADVVHLGRPVRGHHDDWHP